MAKRQSKDDRFTAAQGAVQDALVTLAHAHGDLVNKPPNKVAAGVWALDCLTPSEAMEVVEIQITRLRSFDDGADVLAAFTRIAERLTRWVAK